MLFIDFETRSHCNLLTAGSHRYATHPTTEIICLGWHLNGEDGVVEDFADLPDYVCDYLQGDGLVAAWNAGFDRLIWSRFAPDALQLPLRRWFCLAAQARVNALPGSLNDCARAVWGRYKKDVRGPQLIKAMSIPPFEDTPLLRREMGEYCLQDVRVSVDLHYAMRNMTPTEHRDYINNEIINDDGIEVDTFLAGLAIKYASDETRELAKRLNELTDGVITKHTQVQRIRKWVLPQLDDKARDLLVVAATDSNAPTKITLDKNARQRLLMCKTLPPDVREVVELLDEGNRSSVAKFTRMLERADPRDRRVRGAFVYAGASQTLRFASRGLQLHNFARDCLSPAETEDVIDIMEADEPLPDTMATLSKALRPALVPSEGCKFIVGDWKGIEACALPWLSGDSRAKERLNILRDPDRDIYVETQRALGLESRQLGKVVELSMGYGGSIGAFKTMAAAYGVDYPEDQIKPLVVDAWREANPWARDFWDALTQAAWAAVSSPLSFHSAGRVSFCFYPALVGGTLICTLPGGAMIQYPHARISSVDTALGVRTTLTAMKANWSPAAGQKTWPRVSLWRGLLAENITQAFCGVLLRDCIDRLLGGGWPVVAHVHDEVVIEVDAEFAEEGVRSVTKVMEYVPEWAGGLPLIADVTSMTRYGK